MSYIDDLKELKRQRDNRTFLEHVLKRQSESEHDKLARYRDRRLNDPYFAIIEPEHT